LGESKEKFKWAHEENIHAFESNNIVCLFVFLPLQPIVVVFSHPGSGL
jgi:hypothetical protein